MKLGEIYTIADKKACTHTLKTCIFIDFKPIDF